MQTLSVAFTVCITLAWMLPTPGERGLSAGLGVLLVAVWSRRLSALAGRRLVLALGVVIVATHRTTMPSGIVPSALAVVVLGLSGGGPGIAALVAGGALSLWLERLAPAALLTGAIAIRAGRLSPRREWIIVAGALGIAAVAGSAIATRGQGPARCDAAACRRLALAAWLNAENPRVIAWQAFGLAHDHDPERRRSALDYVARLERASGPTATTDALRVVTNAASGEYARARAYLAEAAQRQPAALDSLSAWSDSLAPWAQLAAFLHTGRPAIHRLKWPEPADLASDSLSAEYAARVLASAGLEAEACTLASLPQWRSRGWARFIVWKARQPFEAPASWVSARRAPMPLGSGEWLLVRGDPARGVWPQYRIVGDQIERVDVTAEQWIILPRAVQGSADLSLVNDLRAPREDRNLLVSSTLQWDDGWFVVPSPSLERFRFRVVERLSRWGDSPPVVNTLPPGGDRFRVPPTSLTGVRTDPDGWLMAGPGRIRWEWLSCGDYELVLRGEPAAGLWPVVELSGMGRYQRRVVDSWEWSYLPVRIPETGSPLSIRFVNDYWDPAAAQDRNLRVNSLLAGDARSRTDYER